jgi:beta-ketodecanoyl-[acyl-carrier-protein] synthase
MNDISIIGTGLWYPDEITTNEEIVNSYNTYVDNYNEVNKHNIAEGSVSALAHSSEEFIAKASGIKTRRIIDKKNSLDPDLMRPVTKNEDESELSLLAQVGISAAKKAMENANISADQIDGVILGTSHSGRNYPAIAIEIQEELGINGYAYDMLVGCSSTTFAISNAYTDIASGMSDTVLVINPEITTPGLSFTNRDVHFIFGDGCVATIYKEMIQKALRFLIENL